MKTGLIFAVLFSIIRGCSSATACTPFQTPVAGACTATQSGQVYGNLTLYLDTGTGPNDQENRCRCSLSLSHTNTRLVFQSLASSFNHAIIVAGYVLNSTTTRVEVVLVSDPTDLWIKTDGVGGVCVSVAIQPPDSEKRFGINCFTQQSSILTTTTSRSSVTTAATETTETTETTSSNPTSSSKSQIYVHGQDKENLIGPVVGGVSGFVVLVSIAAIAIYCIRRKYSMQKKNGTHSDETSTVQAKSKNMDMTENSVSNKAVADNRAISVIDNSYDHVILDHNAGCYTDKKNVPIKPTNTGNDYHIASDRYHKTENPVIKAVTKQTRENLTVYSVVNKHPKLLTNTTQDSNDNVYDRTDSADEKVKGMEEYNRLGDNAYDLTDNTDKKVKGLEEYNRLGAFQAHGIDTEDTYDSAAKNTGYNVDRNVQNDYDTSYRKN